MTKHVAVYCRISRDKSGRTEGVQAQRKWGTDYAASAWPDLPVEIFSDNNLSAANGDTRPEYDRFRKWLAEGRIAHVWCVEQSRLERREIGWFMLAAELDAAGVSEVHTNRDGVLRVHDEVSGIRAVLAAGETRKLKLRVVETLAERAAAGRPGPGRMFGYAHATDADGGKTLVVIPEQADAIRWAADRVLDGWSLTNVARELRARGLVGTNGGKIDVGTVRSMCTNPTISGLRVHQGRVVGKGIWQQILGDETRQAVIAKLSSERVVRRKDGMDYRVTTGQNGRPKGRRYVLTGLAYCGVCEAPLVGTQHQRRTKSGVVARPYLVCMPSKGGRMCIGIAMEQAEKHILDELFRELDRPEFLDALESDDSEERRKSVLDALGACERQRAELAEMWATPGELTAAEWRTARRAISEQEQKLRADLASIPAPRGSLDIEAARAAYPLMTLDEKREFTRQFIERVTINRAALGASKFDPGRVSIAWRTL